MALNFSFGNLPFAFTTERVTDSERIDHIRKHGPGGGFFPLQWWDLTEDKVWDDGEKTEAGVYVQTSEAHCLVIMTMSIDMGSITEKNWTEFYRRVNAMERLMGAHRRRKNDEDEWENVYFTPAEVKAHIGLQANVAKTTDAQWRKRLMEMHRRGVDAAISNMEN
jgi:hypothetical protein